MCSCRSTLRCARVRSATSSRIAAPAFLTDAAHHAALDGALDDLPGLTVLIGQANGTEAATVATTAPGPTDPQVVPKNLVAILYNSGSTGLHFDGGGDGASDGSRDGASRVLVPRAIEQVASLPTTPYGKVDYQRLVAERVAGKLAIACSASPCTPEKMSVI